MDLEGRVWGFEDRSFLVVAEHGLSYVGLGIVEGGAHFPPTQGPGLAFYGKAAYVREVACLALAPRR